MNWGAISDALNSGDVASLLTIVGSASYLIIFLLMTVEGPVVTIISAFAASLGYLNLAVVILLAVLGGITGDLVHFLIGRLVRRGVLERYMQKKGLNKKAINALEDKLSNHLWKTLAIIKSSPIGSVGLLLSGASKIPMQRLILVSAVTTLPITLFYTLLGYYFGFALGKVLHIVKVGQYLFLFLIIFAILSYLVVKKISSIIVSRLEEK